MNTRDPADSADLASDDALLLKLDVGDQSQIDTAAKATETRMAPSDVVARGADFPPDVA